MPDRIECFFSSLTNLFPSMSPGFTEKLWILSVLTFFTPYYLLLIIYRIYEKINKFNSFICVKIKINLFEDTQMLPDSGTITAAGTIQIRPKGPKTHGGNGVFATIYIWGTWSGASVQVQASPDAAGSQKFDVEGAVLNSNGYKSFQINADSMFLVTTGTPTLNWKII